MRAVAVLLLAAGCSFHPTAVLTDGGVDGAVDARPDAMMLVGRQQMELVSATGRLHAGSMTIDVELGRPSSNTQVVGVGTITIEAAPVIAP